MSEQAERLAAEGWFQDPYRIHEDRWYSQGEPTKLVRDHGVESFDPPPADVVPTAPLRRSKSDGSPTADDLRRADEAERDDTATSYSGKVWEVIGQQSGHF